MKFAVIILIFFSLVLKSNAEDKPAPTLPKDYSLMMEITDNDINDMKKSRGDKMFKPMNSSLVMAYRSSIQDLALIVEFKNDGYQRIYFDFNKKQKIVVVSTPNQDVGCSVTSLPESEKWIFENASATDTGKMNVFQAEWIFRMGETGNELLLDNSSYSRDIPVTQYFGDYQELSVNVLHFWSRPDLWQPPNSIDGSYTSPVPITKKIIFSTARRNYTRTISIFNLINGDPPVEVFRIPDGVYCPKLNTADYKVPSLSEHYSFQVEVIEGLTTETVKYQKHFYDADLNLTRLDVQFDNSPDIMTLIEDFNTGKFYIIDQTVGNCSITTIKAIEGVSPTTQDNYVIADPLKFLTGIRNSSEFTYYEKNVARGIKALVFKTINDTKDYSTVMEWWFSSYLVGYDEDYLEIRVPLKFVSYKKNKQLNAVTSTRWNIFNFNLADPEVLKDIGTKSCFEADKKQDYTFSLDKRYDQLSISNLDLLKKNILLVLKDFANISPLRINRIELDVSDTYTIVLFTINEPPKGDTQEISIAMAIEKINTILKLGSIEILVPQTNGGIVAMYGVEGSLQYIGDMDQYKCDLHNLKLLTGGYSSGSMAALGICMTIIGLICGVLIVLVYKNRYGLDRFKGPLSYPREFEHKTFVNTEDPHLSESHE